jgi:hypothetical protein
MTRPTIPADVRQFIMQAIVSVPYLEALLLMRAAGNAGMDRAGLADALYINEFAATQLLGQLRDAGLVQASQEHGENGLHYVYAATAAQAGLIDRLAEEYAHNLIGVSMLIHATGMQARSAPTRF